MRKNTAKIKNETNAALGCVTFFFVSINYFFTVGRGVCCFKKRATFLRERLGGDSAFGGM